ncbi:L-rhamnose mutarotase [Haloarcula salina]|uniref:L-rhamnose mutarotase n=1 Tax=Haloarcula salina TaxID=1429914 RepID=A0AA41G0G4_9EURY|nr:L-rhamnose mutarotase [Haloarcula salina]MBV0901324.1 L-rhamnose mutarotase [Haloarcula salina]
MARIAFHLEIADGKRDAYRAKHENVPDALEAAYLESDAGLETYSVFEKDGHVFGFMEVEDPDVIQEVMEGSEAQAEWAEEMAGITLESDDSWMDEVYRMV